MLMSMRDLGTRVCKAIDESATKEKVAQYAHCRPALYSLRAKIPPRPNVGAFPASCTSCGAGTTLTTHLAA